MDGPKSKRVWEINPEGGNTTQGGKTRQRTREGTESKYYRGPRSQRKRGKGGNQGFPMGRPKKEKSKEKNGN